MKESLFTNLRIGIDKETSLDLTGRDPETIGKIIVGKKNGESLRDSAKRVLPELVMPKAHWIKGYERH